jgi:hypothetical protein
VITAAAINVGFEVMLFWMFATTVAVQRSLLPRDPNFERFRRAIPLERGLALGTALILLGLITVIGAISEWSVVGFGVPPRSDGSRSASLRSPPPSIRRSLRVEELPLSRRVYANHSAVRCHKMCPYCGVMSCSAMPK